MRIIEGVDRHRSRSIASPSPWLSPASRCSSTCGRRRRRANKTGSSNSFFGRWAGFKNNTGARNSFFGASAGESNTSGFDNASFGNLAGRDNTSGSDNTSLGGAAGTHNTTGATNVYLGRSAGLSNTTETGNTFLGAFSNGGPGVNHSTAIGFNASVTQSFSIVLGNSETLGVGIGTTAPSARLHVVGSSFSVATPLAILQSNGNQIPLAFKIGTTETARIKSDSVGNLVFTTLDGTSKDIHFRAGDDSTTDMIVKSSNGNVGIGTSAPGAARLKVQGGNVFIAQPDSLVITSPNGSCWQIRVSDAGALFSGSVPCP